MPIVTLSKPRAWRWAAFFALALAILGPIPGRTQETPEVDTALVVSIESRTRSMPRATASNSKASRKPSKTTASSKPSSPAAAVASDLARHVGRQAEDLDSLVAHFIQEDALAIAQQVRRLPREGGEFTCMSGMMRMIADKVVTQIPATANRIVVDVSGDGKDNCNREEPVEVVRDDWSIPASSSTACRSWKATTVRLSKAGTRSCHRRPRRVCLAGQGIRRLRARHPPEIRQRDQRHGAGLAICKGGLKPVRFRNSPMRYSLERSGIVHRGRLALPLLHRPLRMRLLPIGEERRREEGRTGSCPCRRRRAAYSLCSSKGRRSGRRR